MIFIITVHYQSDKWIDIQLKYIKKCVREQYKIFACLNGVNNIFFDKFYYADDIAGSHAYKLNFLAAKVISQARDDDMLIFMDGDAFPINTEIISYIRDKISKHKLIAIRRDENGGDKQPHPSFCATTAKFWRDIGGDWEKGYCWEIISGKKRTDVGANLLKKLNDKKINWFAMQRSNRKNLHPVCFGIYDNMIYHHGSGFRENLCTADCISYAYVLMRRMQHYKTGSQFILNRIIRFIGITVQRVWQARREMLSSKVYRAILANEDFYSAFISKMK
jgi:hypothetical protein